MVIAKIKVDGVSAVATELSQIPKGIQGATIEVTYDGAWESLNKTAVFSGSVVKDVVNVGAVISVPPETVAKSGHRLRVGFYGVDGENKVIIPTLWVDLGAIQSAADPSGDASTNPSLPVWAQLQADVEALKKTGGGTGTGATAEQAAQIAQNKEDIEKLSREKLDASKLPEAVKGIVNEFGAVSYNKQTPTEEQKAQARENIGVNHSREGIIPEPPKAGGAYELQVHILDGKKIYYWEKINESARRFYNYYPVEKGVLSPNDLFTCSSVTAMAAQDGAFYKELLYLGTSEGDVTVVDFKKGEIIAGYRHDKRDLLKTHANSVSVVEIDDKPYMYSNIYNSYENEENKHIGECCVYKGYDYSLNFGFMLGNLSSATGEWTATDTRQVTDYLNIKPLSSIKITNATDIAFIVSCYDSNKNYLGQFSTDQQSLIKNSGQWFYNGTEVSITALKSVAENVEYVRILNNVGVGTPNITLTYDNTITDTLVQLLKIGFIDNTDLWADISTESRPYGNFIADVENNFLYVYVIDKAADSTKWHKFNLPSVTDGEYDSNYGCLVVTLEETDIIESWTTSYLPFIQGCCYYDGKLWITYGGGVNASGIGVAKMVVIDLNTKTIIATINFAEAGIKAEPEFVDFYKGDCYYASADTLYRIKFV